MRRRAAILTVLVLAASFGVISRAGAANHVSRTDPTGDDGDDFDPRGDIVAIAIDDAVDGITLSVDTSAFDDPGTSDAWTTDGSSAEFGVDLDGDHSEDVYVELYNDGSHVVADVNDAQTSDLLCNGTVSTDSATSSYSVAMPASCLGSPASISMRVTFGYLTDDTVSIDDTDWTPTALAPAVPSAPGNVTAIAGDEQATVSWTAPASNGSDLTGYEVTASPGGATVDVGAAQTSTAVSGLTNGVAYTFSVTATNAVGTGAASAPSAPVTPAGVPAAPTGVHATGGAGSATVSWQAADGNGSAVTSYTVTATPGNAHTTVTAAHTSAVLALAAGSYSFQVVATNARGTSAPSAAAHAKVDAAATPRSGYWMLDQSGHVYAFGNATNYGSPTWTSGAVARAMAPRADGTGYWVVGTNGRVRAFGSARWFGDAPPLLDGEFVTTISATPKGDGYWLFTNRGRAIAFGAAPFLGDMHDTPLNGGIVASVATPTGRGYYMVGADGGVFCFGDAHFHGSTGGMALNQPVVGISPTPNNTGYWLVASDGGVFAFKAPFRGSMGGTALNKPVNGLVAFGDGYLMVASDGGVFDFSNRPFYGSLAATPPPAPVIAISAFATG